jgi:hypothetical protein
MAISHVRKKLISYVLENVSASIIRVMGYLPTVFIFTVSSWSSASLFLLIHSWTRTRTRVNCGYKYNGMMSLITPSGRTDSVQNVGY